MKITVCALYHFFSFPDFKDWREPLKQQMLEHKVQGSLLIAAEGINGTVAGPQAGIDALLAFLTADERMTDLDYKLSYTDHQPFLRTKVKLKKEIVTMGVPGIDPNHTVGTYLNPEQWNEVISDPDTVLIDARNDYEYQVGTFKGAINPNTDTFREFPGYLDETLKGDKSKKVAMFCTGGIRCEKATAYLKEQGFDEVYHLKGGILKYLEETPEENTLWQGECFVFDERVTVDHDLQPGHYQPCYACGRPLSEQDRQHQDYVKGVSCEHCVNETTPEQKRRFAQRQKQIELARQRGAAHRYDAKTAS